MTSILIAISNILHALATVIFIGYFLLLSIIYLPALSKLEGDASLALGEISRRSRPWLYASMLIFAATGTYLTLADANYRGLGNFGNPWAILMLVKHILLFAMIVLGGWFNALQRVGMLLRSNSGVAQGLAKFRQYTTAMTVCGVLVLVLTAIAQAL